MCFERKSARALPTIARTCEPRTCEQRTLNAMGGVRVRGALACACSPCCRAATASPGTCRGRPGGRPGTWPYATYACPAPAPSRACARMPLLRRSLGRLADPLDIAAQVRGVLGLLGLHRGDLVLQLAVGRRGGARARARRRARHHNDGVLLFFSARWTALRGAGTRRLEKICAISASRYARFCARSVQVHASWKRCPPALSTLAYTYASPWAHSIHCSTGTACPNPSMRCARS